MAWPKHPWPECPRPKRLWPIRPTFLLYMVTRPEVYFVKWYPQENSLKYKVSLPPKKLKMALTVTVLENKYHFQFLPKFDQVSIQAISAGEQALCQLTVCFEFQSSRERRKGHKRCDWQMVFRSTKLTVKE